MWCAARKASRLLPDPCRSGASAGRESSFRERHTGRTSGSLEGAHTPGHPMRFFLHRSAALATLIDEGKISWDDPVYERLPGFQMYDPYVSHEMTIRDLLTHRSGMGLGEGDLLFWPHTTFTRAEID